MGRKLILAGALLLAADIAYRCLPRHADYAHSIRRTWRSSRPRCGATIARNAIETCSITSTNRRAAQFGFSQPNMMLRVSVMPMASGEFCGGTGQGEAPFEWVKPT
jgi:hypothetical protein